MTKSEPPPPTDPVPAVPPGTQPAAPTAPSLTGFQYRGLTRTTRPPACVISPEDLRRLYTDLDKKAQEALDRQLSTMKPPANTSESQFDALKRQARDLGHVTVEVQGAHGEQVAHTSIEPLDPENLPQNITSIVFDSAAALQLYNVTLPNRFSLRLDFSEPPAFVTYDPWNEPTPNNSRLEVSGPDDTWVTATYQTVLTFFESRKKRRGWLHDHAGFNLLNWFIGIPASLWAVYRLDSQLIRLVPDIHGALRGAVDVYLFLATMLVFRITIYGLRWMFPLVELEGSRTKTARRAVGFVIASLFVALLYDVLKKLFL